MSFMNKKMVFLLCVVVSPAYIFFQLHRIIERTNSTLCIIDCYCLESEKCIFIELIIWTLLIIFVLKDQFRMLVIIRQKNIRNFLFHIIKKFIRLIVFTTMYLYMCTTIIGGILTNSICNWNTGTSYAFYEYGILTEVSPSIIELSISYMVIKTSILFLTVVMIVCAWWYMNNPLLGYILMVLIYSLETAANPPYAKIFFYYVNINFSNVFFGGIDMIKMIIFPIIVNIIVFIVFVFCIRKRDWIKT